MRIGGLQKLTLVDFPGKIAACIFCQGCNFRCGFCHNRELVLPQFFQEPLDPQTVLSYLGTRKKKLEGVVISGGEPTIQEGLFGFIAQIKAMGFAVKLDTNGSHPEVILSLLDACLLDYIAMDVKAPFEQYIQVTGVACDTAKIKKSIQLVINSGIPYQFRTTLMKRPGTQDDLRAIGHLIEGARHYVLQSFVFSSALVNPTLDSQAQYTDSEMALLKSQYDRG